MNATQLKKKQLKITHLMENGKLKEAIKPLLQICKQQPDNTNLWLRLASLYGQTGDFHSVIKVCRKIEPLLKDHPILYSLMGNAYTSLNIIDKSYKCYQKALELQPNDPGILNNFGNALYLDNKLEEAADVLERVISIKPDYADAHNNLGNIYRTLNNNALAIKHYENAVKLYPHQYEVLLNLAYMYAERISHPELAESYFRKALAIKPDSIEAMSGISDMLCFQGKLDDALIFIKQVQAKLKDEPGPIAAEADIYERTGNYNEAYKLVRKIIDKKISHPVNTDVFMKICDKFNCCDEALTEGEKLISNQDITPKYIQNTHFGLGKLYDKLRRYDEAFMHYKAGNEALDIVFDPHAFKIRIDNLISTYNSESIANIAKSNIDTKLPIFIIGMPRSGTSLTEQILASHPEVCGAGELNDINEITAGLPETLNVTQPYPACITLLTSNTCNNLAQRYLDKLTNLCAEHRYVTDKMPHNFLNIGLISLLFPQAKIIHCVRDPRDTCLSIYFQNFGWLHPYGTRLDWLGAYYQEYARIMKHWKALKIPIHTVKYDDMVNDQKTTTRKMLEYCNLKWDDACLDFHKDKRMVATASYGQVRQKIYTKSLARWKNYEKDIAVLVDNLGNTLDGWPD